MQIVGKVFKCSLVSILLFLGQTSYVAAAADLTGESPPMRIKRGEEIFVHVLIACWIFSIPYFMFVISSIGIQWMLSGGDEQKLTALKKRGGNVVMGFGLVFGGYLVVRLVMSLLLLGDPNACFASPLEDTAVKPFFQFFFPGICS